jgi:hypothetical protein
MIVRLFFLGGDSTTLRQAQDDIRPDTGCRPKGENDSPEDKKGTPKDKKGTPDDLIRYSEG